MKSIYTLVASLAFLTFALSAPSALSASPSDQPCTTKPTRSELAIRMPMKEEFLKAEGIDEESWNQNSDGRHMFFMTMYVFNKAVNTLSTSDLEKIARDDGDQVIGCHNIVGAVCAPKD